jgi:DNA-binding PadR family transcriptional regulator
MYLTIYRNLKGVPKMHGCCESNDGRWAAGRHRRGRFGGYGFGGGGRHGGFGGMGADDMRAMRAGRMLAQGDLRLIALALIAEAPRHGYEIIKLVEEKTADWYSPSPGIVYPTLTYLEEAGYVTASTEGSKKLYAITAEGRAYLDANRDVVDAVLDRLAALGERVNRWRRASRAEREDRALPPLVEAAFDHLRATVSKRLENDAEAEARLVEILARAAADLQRS